jgi:hypothetical protein
MPDFVEFRFFKFPNYRSCATGFILLRSFQLYGYFVEGHSLGFRIQRLLIYLATHFKFLYIEYQYVKIETITSNHVYGIFETVTSEIS